VPLETQLGVKAESTWGTAVTVDKFFEFNSESINLETGRVESSALRASQRVQRSDRFTPYILGAAGSIELDVLSKGFGFWLEQCLGAIATGTETDSTYTHTGTVGTLLAQGFTLQVNRPFHPAGTNQAFTYEGGKVSKWGFKCSTEGNLVFTADLVFETGLTATALATASYPTGMENLTWAGGAVTVAGTAVPVTEFSVEVDNGLDTARHKLRSSTLRQEPVEAKNREITWSLTADFESLVQYNRVVSTTAAGAVAAIIATWTAPTLAGTTTYPSLTVTIDAARFDEIGDFTATSTDPLMQSLSGRGLYDGTDSPITVAYVSTDATP
jgi:hypothetical protein